MEGGCERLRVWWVPKMLARTRKTADTGWLGLVGWVTTGRTRLSAPGGGARSEGTMRGCWTLTALGTGRRGLRAACCGRDGGWRCVQARGAGRQVRQRVRGFLAPAPQATHAAAHALPQPHSSRHSHLRLYLRSNGLHAPQRPRALHTQNTARVRRSSHSTPQLRSRPRGHPTAPRPYPEPPTTTLASITRKRSDRQQPALAPHLAVAAVSQQQAFVTAPRDVSCYRLSFGRFKPSVSC
jgi:hypothetical protein